MIPWTKIHKGERTEHTLRAMGPLFVWNIISKCNLKCAHCYRESSPELKEADFTDTECINLASEIKKLNPPIVLLSGGEPLLRPNIFDIIKACKDEGLRVGLSTNGTLINTKMAKKIKEAKVDYVGVSIDGREEWHDIFRGSTGSFNASWEGIKLLNNSGVKTGVRFTLTASNSYDLFYVLDKTVQSGTKRFCLYHLVYSGRASSEQDLPLEDKRKLMEKFLLKVREISLKDPEFEVLTTDNPADGIFMLENLADKKEAVSCITAHRGCSAGDRVVYLDSNGDVFPCQFLRDSLLGNVRKKPLFDILNDRNNELLQQFRNKKDHLEGRCGSCRHKEICGGCRARAKAYYGSLWAEDPACYLEQTSTKTEDVLVNESKSIL
ncbi:MAG: radical SAM protein [Candidatus Omnitrophica bacterium]|nr:radical SAM protein [Candidatus Omnitrophota bacterium]